MAKMIKDMNEIPTMRDYLRRIGAEPRSLRTAVVKEHHGAYWTDKAVIVLERTGDVKAPAPYEPTKEEAEKIKEEAGEFEFPSQIRIKSLSSAPDAIKKADPENVFVFREPSGDIIMVQVRIDPEDGGKNGAGEKRYIPWTYWTDSQWRPAEPEGPLPLWGLDQLGDYTTVFIHEGAKAARAMRDMVAAETVEMKEKLRDHPWGEEMKGAAHLGWIGGALSPRRTDWGVLKTKGVKRAYIVSDNDAPGVSAVAKISKELYFPTYHVQFSSQWPMSFDMADPFPKEMFKKIGGVTHYNGPAFTSVVEPATWATDLIPHPEPRRKPIAVLREHFKDQWVYVDESDLWVLADMPHIIRSETVLNKMMAGLSHSSRTGELLLKSYKGRKAKFAYRPDIKGQMIVDRDMSAINLYVAPTIKSVKGDPGPWIEYLEYMFPNEHERKGVEKWCATLIAKPAIRMEYGLLLISEAQGIGKTTLGSEILGKLVGPHNVGTPSEKSITESQFNDWIAKKRLIVVNEIYSGHSWKAYNHLKTYITDNEVQVNAKFQTPYVLDNWAHIIACSNSMRALRMEQDDRRWFYPEVTETRWPPEKFAEFYNWLASGGLQIINWWAENYGEYVKKGDRAPTTDRKKEMIDGSRSEAQTEAVALAEAAAKVSSPVVLAQKDITTWVRTQVQGKVFDTDYEIRRAMRDKGMHPSKERVYVEKRLQYAVINQAAHDLIKGTDKKAMGEILRQYVIAPSDLLENDM